MNFRVTCKVGNFLTVTLLRLVNDIHGRAGAYLRRVENKPVIHGYLSLPVICTSSSSDRGWRDGRRGAYVYCAGSSVLISVVQDGSFLTSPVLRNLLAILVWVLMLAVPSEVRREESGCQAGGGAKDVQSFTTHPSLCRAVFLSSARSHKSFRTCFLSLTISFCPCSLATLCSPKASTPRNLPQALAIWRPLPHFFLAEPNFVSAFHLFSYIVWKSMESLLGNKIFLYDGNIGNSFSRQVRIFVLKCYMFCYINYIHLSRCLMHLLYILRYITSYAFRRTSAPSSECIIFNRELIRWKSNS